MRRWRRRRSRQASTCGLRSRSASTGRAGAPFSSRPTRPGCWSGSPPTPCSARGCRPLGARSRAATSVHRCPRRPCCSTRDQTSSIRTRSSCSPRAPVISRLVLAPSVVRPHARGPAGVARAGRQPRRRREAHLAALPMQGVQASVSTRPPKTLAREWTPARAHGPAMERSGSPPVTRSRRCGSVSRR